MGLETIIIISALGVLIVLAIIILIVVARGQRQNNSGELEEMEDNLIGSMEKVGSFLINRINEIPVDQASQIGELKVGTAEMLGKMQSDHIREFGALKYELTEKVQENFVQMNEILISRINELNQRVNLTLEENFKKSNDTFKDVLKRLTAIDEAQKKIDSLSTEIVSLQSVLTDKKTRGIFGEVNLNFILSNVFGEGNKGENKIYDIQHLLPNGTIADAVVNAPEPIGLLCIDSKFPLENYQKMTDKTLSADERAAAEKLFKSDVKRHIDAIADKYIIPGKTTMQAVMFLPAEAIFAEIHAYHDDVLKYSYNRNVWITSPTTMMSTLSTIFMIIKNIERDKYAKDIHENLILLSKEFDRYKQRWDNLSKHIDTVSKDVHEINATTNKITSKFNRINNVDKKLLTENIYHEEGEGWEE